MKKLIFILLNFIPLYAMKDKFTLIEFIEDNNKNRPQLGTPEFETYKSEYIRIYLKTTEEELNLDQVLDKEVPSISSDSAKDCRTQGIMDAFFDAILNKPSRFPLPKKYKLPSVSLATKTLLDNKDKFKYHYHDKRKTHINIKPSENPE